MMQDQEARNVRVVQLAVVTIATWFAGFGALAAPAGRPFTVDDYLKIQQLDEAELAPGARLVAVTVSRPRRVGDNYRDPVADARLPTRNDLVVLATDTGRAVFRVDGFAQKASVGSPRWSPDGRRLAYLVRTPDAVVSLQIWDAKTGHTRTLAQGLRGGEPNVLRSYGGVAPFAWNGDAEIVVTRAGNLAEEQASDVPVARKRGEGGQLSVRTWQTQHDPICRPDDELVALRLDGHEALIAKGAIASASLADAGDDVIVTQRSGRVPPPARTALAKPLAWGIAFQPLLSTWSAARYHRVGDTWKAEGLTVSGGGAVLARTAPRWGPAGGWAALETVDPAAVDPVMRLVQVDEPNAPPRLTVMKDQKSALEALEAFAPSSTQRPSFDFTRLSSQTRAAMGASPTTLSAIGDKAVVLARRADGISDLWFVTDGKASILLELNRHLGDVQRPEPIALAYRANGEDRRGWLFLPNGGHGPAPVVMAAYPSSEPKTPRAMDPDATPELLMLQQRGVAVFLADFRLQRAGQRYFAYDDAVDRVRTELGAAAAALRADARVDGARLGFIGHSFGGYTAVSLLAHSADFKAVVASAPIGDLVSYFSETPNYFINQTCGPEQVFAAQMNHEGIGEDLPGNRFFTMPGPPYAWPDIYTRNSPLLHLGGAKTAALIIQGSEDGFRDGDRVFNTLYRQGVDAELLYYWGEGHSIAGPANLRHRIERTVDWLYEHLEPR